MAVTTTKGPPITPNFLFAQLSARVKDKPEVLARIVAHIREVSGHNTLPAYHNNGGSDPEKLEVYGTCLKAVISGDFSGLKGQVPKGQAPSIEVPPAQGAPADVASYRVGCKTGLDEKWCYNGCRFATADEAKAYGQDLHSRWTALKSWDVHPCDEPPTYKWEQGKLVDLAAKPELKPETTTTATAPQEPPKVLVVPVGNPATPQVASAVDPKIAAVMAALQGLVQPATPAPAIDEKAIRKVVEQVLAEQLQKAVAIQLKGILMRVVSEG